ncbi:HpcH/HpaI aldolase family protein [Chachezhania sediminis]|uniref:HpcH/HpaI aldolase family protein n=1 Tax=Chachezhania sediminis TaxID=2599291 RepID=UPI00131DB0F6|nr:aldolase/citrate lyase family protein [Chachezhania sediminis]
MTRPSFRNRFAAGERLLGSFVKSASVSSIEILALAGFDFVIIDEEHAPIGRESTDVLLLAARAHGIPALVRVRDNAAPDILSALDCGADGVLVPHVRSTGAAERMVTAAFYGIGRRGFSPSGRAGGYGNTTLKGHIASQDEKIALVAMIEDPEAVVAIDDILRTEGVEGIFIGRGDLAAAMGAETMNDPQVEDAVNRILAAAQAAGKPVCMMAETPAMADAFAARGASAFVIGSDQGFLKNGASEARHAFAAGQPTVSPGTARRRPPEPEPERH